MMDKKDLKAMLDKLSDVIISASEVKNFLHNEWGKTQRETIKSLKETKQKPFYTGGAIRYRFKITKDNKLGFTADTLQHCEKCGLSLFIEWGIKSKYSNELYTEKRCDWCDHLNKYGIATHPEALSLLAQESEKIGIPLVDNSIRLKPSEEAIGRR